MSEEINVYESMAPAYWDIYDDIQAFGHSEYWFKGGRGSTKSSFISLVIIMGLLNDRNANAIVYRRVSNTLKDSVYAQMIWAINQIGIGTLFKYRSSPYEIILKKTGQRILFRGADDPMKSKSIKLTHGYFKYLWFEELAEFSSMRAIRTIKQSIFRGVDKACTLYSYNPPKSAQSWVNEEALNTSKLRLTHHSTYLDVPPEWLGEEFIIEANDLKETNKMAYDNEYMGVVTGNGGMVFENVTVRPITQDEIEGLGWFYQGIDWGYFPDPFQWVRMGFDAKKRKLYIVDEYRANKMGNAETFDALKKKLNPDEMLTADSAEPKSIADWRNFGASWIHGVKKGPGSVAYSIKWLASLAEIIIDERCKHTAKEFIMYEFERNKDGDFVNGYCEYVHHGSWVAGRHHRLICDVLDRVARGELKRVMFWLPPQHGKSMTITETFPSYYLGRNPRNRVIEASYNDDFARKFGRRNREKIIEFGSRLWNIGLSQINFGASRWDLDNDIGGMLSVGIGGAATGEGADLLIVDDPIKDNMEATSETYRNRLWDEYRSTFKTRVHPGGAIIVVMTRWHEDDLCGRLLNPEHGRVEDWTIIRLPAISEGDDDPLGRPEGEALWPEHGYDEEWLQQQKGALGSYAFAGLYQQRPAPAEGGILKRSWFQFYDVLPSNGTQIHSWDCTFKDGQKNDFVAGHIWQRTGPNFYLVDRVHDHMGISDTMRAIRTLAAKHPRARGKLIEDKANGTAVIELLRKEIPGLIPIDPQGGKVVRAQAIAPYAEAGNIFLPNPRIAPWVHDFLEECAAFPNAAHDDDVDAMTQAINYLAANMVSGLPPKDYGNDKQSYWR